MDCRGARRRIYQWLDQELDQSRKSELEAHLKICANCQMEAKSGRELHALLRSEGATILPSADFEETFWRKVSETQREPRMRRFFRDLEAVLSMPSFSQAFAAIVIGLLLGGSGGVLTILWVQSPPHRDGNSASIQSLSGFSEVKGLPSPSLAATYLRTIEGKSSL